MKHTLLITILLIGFNVVSQPVADTLTLFFEIDERMVNENHRELLRSISFHDADSIKIIGYADYLGYPEYNKALSFDRAKNILKVVETDKAVILKGKGATGKQDLDPKVGDPVSRRVDVVIYRADQAVLTHHSGKLLADANHSFSYDFAKNIREGDNIIWENINFFKGRHVMIPESVPSLRNLLDMLKKYPNMHIQIQGHICCIEGSGDAIDIDTWTENLSENRARAIYKYLIRNGIEPDRLSYQGFGKSRPLFKEERTEEEMLRNRRVEIKVVHF